MVRMIHIVGSMSPSGIGNFIMNVYRNIDRQKVQFDFIVHEHRDVSFDEEIKALGGRLFYVTRKAVSPIKNFREICRVIRKGHYRIVFRHTDISTVAVDLLAAKLGGANVRIAHSHSTSTPNVTMHRLFRPLLNMLCTRRFACSEKAGRWLYGKAPFEVVINAIRLEDFAYDPEKRERTRKAEGWADCLVVGHVGNLLPVKNHLFMLDIMAELVKRRPDAKMIFAGDGAMRKQIEEKRRALGLEDRVVLLGVRTDTGTLLQAMDVFLFPSRYEGLPIAMVEAQCSGLPNLVSDVITGDVDVTPLVHRMSLERPAAEWAERILALAEEERKAADERLFAEKGFDIREMVRRYEELA
ncbi:glycosyltransferase family 1 protein [Lachnospiraceae bacterium JLR.KK008]